MPDQPFEHPHRTSPTPQPNSGAMVLTLGILSIVLSGCALASLPCGIIGWRKALADEREIAAGNLSDENKGMITAGKICSIVGTVISGLALLLWCLYGAFMLLVFGGLAAAGTAGVA